MHSAGVRQEIRPEGVFEKWLRTRFLFPFLAGFGMTLLVHAFAFLNHINHHDQVRNVYAIPGSFNVGRWFINPVIEIGTRLSMPWLNGLLFAVELGIVLFLLVDLFEIRSRPMTLLLAWAVVSFPSASILVPQNHLLDVTGFSLMLAVASVWVCNRWKWGIIPGMVIFVFSIGTYQAFWSVAVALVAVCGLRMLLKGQSSDKEIFWQAVRYVIFLVGSMGIYFVVNKIILYAIQMELSPYMGADQMGTLPLRLIPHLMKTGYLTFFSFLFRHASLDAGAFGVALQVVLMLFVLVGIFVATLKQKRTFFQYLCVAGITLLLPLAFNAVYLFNSESVHDLMMFSIAMFYVLVVILADRWLAWGGKQKALAKWVSIGIACVLALTSFHATTFANQMYYISNLEFSAMSAYMNRVIIRMEDHEAYTQETPVIFVGSVEQSGYGNVPFWGLLPRYQERKPLYILRSDSHIRSFLFSYFELTFPAPAAEQEQALRESEAVQAMQPYPHRDCVQLIDGVLVVKVGN